MMIKHYFKENFTLFKSNSNIYIRKFWRGAPIPLISAPSKTEIPNENMIYVCSVRVFYEFWFWKTINNFKKFLVHVVVQHQDIALPSVLTACYSILQSD